MVRVSTATAPPRSSVPDDVRVGEERGGCRGHRERGLGTVEGRVHAGAHAVVVVELECAADVDDESGELAGSGRDVDVVVGLAPEQGRAGCGVKSEGDDAVVSEGGVT